MSKIAETKALEAYPDHPVWKVLYQEGYNQAMQDFLEKAEKILTERMYFLDDEAKELVEDFVEQFKKYMQDESEK